jgi:hypothetical protein
LLAAISPLGKQENTNVQELVTVSFCGAWSSRLVIKGHTGKDIFVTWCPPILHILENGCPKVLAYLALLRGKSWNAR